MEEPTSDMLEHHHRNPQGGAMRAAVFGLSDGLVTNVSLIVGVAGANPGSGIVRLTGLAALVAGAFSMAAGEFVSMQAQRELFERELDVERHALRHSPEGEARELVGIYERKGIDPTVARNLVDEVMQDPDLALETHAREELGINPHQLGMPIQAAITSFFSFALGAFFPLVPWLITSGNAAIFGSIVLGGIFAVIVGVLLGVLTGKSKFRSAFRQLVVAALASAVTYGVGRGIGVGIH